MIAGAVLHNLKDFDDWDFRHYRMTKEEADVCIEVLEKAVKEENKKWEECKND